MLACLALASCTSDRITNADLIARSAGLTRAETRAGDFSLTYYGRFGDPAEPTSVYIEGDGHAWRTRFEPSFDPTPTRPVALELAAADFTAANVLYIARPCQFTRGDPACRTAYWTDRRFSEEVIDAVDRAIANVLASRSPAIHLVGYSGGAAVAALVAARRERVLSLRTVAGNLDHEAVNRFHGVSPMTASLNAIDVAARLTLLPQRHFVGGRDAIVPPFVAERFVRALGAGACAAITRVDGAGHAEGWVEVWRRAASQPPVGCR